MRRKNALDLIRKPALVLLAALLVTLAAKPLWAASKTLALTAAGLRLGISGGSHTSSEGGISEVSSLQSEVSSVISRLTSSAASVSEYPIVRRTMSAAATDTVYGELALSNHTAEHTVNLRSVLALDPVLELVKNARPQVLIIHTHTSECYMTREQSEYDPDYSGISSDGEIGVVAVGEVIAEALNRAGIKTLHETKVFDTDFSSSYENAAKRIKDILEQYSSIEMVLDIHRDSITSDSGAKTAPIAEIDGKTAAQVMILTGCNEAGALSFPSWEYNLRTAVHLQNAMAELYPTLARPIYFTPRRYNMQLTKNSLLIEIGSEVNTLDEALYAAELFSKALIEMLENV